VRDLPFSVESPPKILEFRVRGVKTNIGFLINLLENDTFKNGEATVSFIQDHPKLLVEPRVRDRGTKILKYLANVIVNGNTDVKYVDPNKQFRKPIVPNFNPLEKIPDGTKQKLDKLGPEKFAQWLKKEKKIHARLQRSWIQSLSRQFN